MVSPPKIMIATPMYGGMCTGNYVSGLLLTMAKLRSVGATVYWSNMMNESLITRARNELVRLFLESDSDYLMFVDADISFDGEAVAHLLAADEDVVCGVYPKKEVDWGQIERAVASGVTTGLKDYAGSFVLNLIGTTDAESNESGLVEVRHAGTGFMLIKRGVFDLLAPHVPTYRTSSHKDIVTGEYVKPLTREFFATSIDHTGALLSEDYHFCELWRRHGGKIFVNPFIKLEHVGTYTHTGNILKSGGCVK